MGILIVMIVGAILGWLAAIIVEREDRIGSAGNALAGVGGAIAAALVVGGVPLATGVSPEQLLWSVLGAMAAIVATTIAAARHTDASRKSFTTGGSSAIAAPVHNTKGK